MAKPSLAGSGSDDRNLPADFVKGQPNVLARVKATSPTLIAVTALTRLEVGCGLGLSAERDWDGGWWSSLRMQVSSNG
jgi:hypothetical protein